MVFCGPSWPSCNDVSLEATIGFAISLANHPWELRVNRSQGLAPHKPLLLLVVLEMIENGDLQNPMLRLTPELAFRFSQFGTIVAHRRTQRMDIRLPFFHTSSDGVWNAFTKQGTAALDPKATQFVRINDGFYALCQSAEFRTSARSVLIRNYFEPTEQVALASLVGLFDDGTSQHE